MDWLAELAPGYLFLEIVISLVGVALFMYGKKAQRYPQLAAGLLLGVYPYFVSGFWTTLIVGAAIVGGLWVAVRMGY